MNVGDEVNFQRNGDPAFIMHGWVFQVGDLMTLICGDDGLVYWVKSNWIIQ